MRHEHVLIESNQLVNLMLEYMADDEIINLIGGESDEDGDISNIPPGIWEVSWPEHVIHPRYNHDANYLGVAYDSVSEVPKKEQHKLYRGR